MNSLCIHFVCVWSRSARFMPVPCGVICLSHWSQFCVVSSLSKIFYDYVYRFRLGGLPKGVGGAFISGFVPFLIP